jgi:hypothetical protein
MMLKAAAPLAMAALFFLAPCFMAFAQTEGEPSGPLPAETESLSENPFLPGEQTISLSAGVQIPSFILPETADEAGKIQVGGVFSFTYQYFLIRGLALGGTLAGAFNGTIGGRSLFVSPLAFRTAYWWALMPFEFCVAAEAGAFLMRLDADGILGPFARAGGGAFWRSGGAWSLGLQSYFWLVPEVHGGEYADLTRTAGFVEVSLSAVYHL